MCICLVFIQFYHWWCTELWTWSWSTYFTIFLIFFKELINLLSVMSPRTRFKALLEPTDCELALTNTLQRVLFIPWKFQLLTDHLRSSDEWLMTHLITHLYEKNVWHYSQTLAQAASSLRVSSSHKIRHTHTHTHTQTHPVGLLWTSNQPLTEAATYLTNIRNEYAYRQSDSNLLSQQSSNHFMPLPVYNSQNFIRLLTTKPLLFLHVLGSV
jgi:hypothetical protein